MKKRFTSILIILLLLFVSGCGAEIQNDGSGFSNDPEPMTEGEASFHTTGDAESVKKQISITAERSQEGLYAVFITNNSSTTVDDLEVKMIFKNNSGDIVDFDKDGHDMVLPGSTVVSRMEPPGNFAKYEFELSVELGTNPSYKNHLKEIKAEANQGEDCVIVKFTNNSKVVIEELEYIVLLYKDKKLIDVPYPNDITDIPAGKTVIEKEDAYGIEYDSFKVFINQAHTF